MRMAGRCPVNPIGSGALVFCRFSDPIAAAAVPSPESAVPLAPAARAVADYESLRQQIYGPLHQEGVFDWDSFYGQEYALASVLPIESGLRHELRQASEHLGQVYARTASVVMEAEDELLVELGLPEATWTAVRASLPELLPTVLGRFDFAASLHGLKMLEFNAETPTDVVEAFYVNGRVCQWFGKQDPNAGLTRQLQEAFRRTRTSYEQQGYSTASIVFSSVDWHAEDAGTTRFLMEHSGLAGRYIPLQDLRFFEDRLQVWDGQFHSPVDVWYRLHPLEKMAEEKDSDGFPTGAAILNVAAERRLALINPPAAMVCQSKATQALIWNLQESGEYYSLGEQEAIRRWMLPTYLENRFQGRCAYVTKPFFGREGGAITVYGPDGSVWVRDDESQYWEQPVVFQEYVELPMCTVDTLEGLYCGRMIYGSFLVDGKGSAIVARVGSRITGNMAYYQPLCLAADASKGE